MVQRADRYAISRALAFLLSLSALILLAGPPIGSVLAGPDPCPEPNASPGGACFIGPGGPALGYLDSAGDVDMYGLDLPADSMIVATLTGLPADYALRLTTPEGASKAEVVEPGLQDKTLRLDGLTPGRYYLTVFSPRGDFNANSPYTLTVTYPPSAALTVPTPTGAKQADYIAPPARQYAVSLADLGPGFHEVGATEQEESMLFHVDYLADDARLSGDSLSNNFLLFHSSSRVSWIHSFTRLEPYGADQELTATLNEILTDWRRRYNVEVTQGWGSEQVWSFTQAGGGTILRGILLKHRNAVAVVQTWGFERFATWDHISGLMSRTEKRLWDALR